MVGAGKFERMNHHLLAAKLGGHFKAFDHIRVVLGFFAFTVTVQIRRMALREEQANIVSQRFHFFRKAAPLQIRQRQNILLGYHIIKSHVNAVKAGLANHAKRFQIPEGISQYAVIR